MSKQCAGTHMVREKEVIYFISFRTTVSSITDETATVNISPDLAGDKQQSIKVESVTSNVEIFSIEKVEIP